MHFKTIKKSTFPSCFQDAKYPSKYAHRFPVRLLVFSSFILGSGAARDISCQSPTFRLLLIIIVRAASGLGCSWAPLRIQKGLQSVSCADHHHSLLLYSVGKLKGTRLLCANTAAADGTSLHHKTDAGIRV